MDQPDRFKIAFVAAIRHLGWVCYQMGAGQPYNIQATEDQKASLLQGTAFALSNPDLSPQENHDNWMRMKQSQGWVYGPVKDAAKKTHPDLVSFSKLPKVEADKDTMDCMMTYGVGRLYDQFLNPKG
jgi:hypothetical protein